MAKDFFEELEELLGPGAGGGDPFARREVEEEEEERKPGATTSGVLPAAVRASQLGVIEARRAYAGMARLLNLKNLTRGQRGQLKDSRSFLLEAFGPAVRESVPKAQLRKEERSAPAHRGFFSIRKPSSPGIMVILLGYGAEPAKVDFVSLPKLYGKGHKQWGAAPEPGEMPGPLNGKEVAAALRRLADQYDRL